MKKYIYISALSVALLGMSACADDYDAAPQLSVEKCTVNFSGSVPMSDGISKTALDGYSINFLKGDQVDVVTNDGKSFVVSNTVEALSKTAVFSGETEQYIVDGACSFVGMYPSGKYADGEYVMELPAVQIPVERLLISSPV